MTSELLSTLKVPATNVTACVFGGEDLDEQFITTARDGLDKETLLKEPFSGGLFRVKTNVKGALSNMF